MPETLLHRDFSAGWCPSDSAVDGRPNCLLKMDNLELDRNGALSLIHGTRVLYSGFGAQAHTMFSRFIDGVRYDYSATQNGSVYRNSASIITGGDNKNAAFGTAFNYTLICSGTQRKKDTGTAVQNLGVKAPTAAPTIAQSAPNAPTAIIGNMQANYVIVDGLGLSVIGGNYIQVTTNIDGLFVMQTTSPPATVKDTTVLSGPGGSGLSTDEDFVILSGYIPNPYGVSLQFDILLSPGNITGDQITDFYSYVVNDIQRQATFDTITGAFTLRMQRSDFIRNGGSALDWSTVYGFRLTINLNRESSEIVNIWGAEWSQVNFQFRGGTAAQFGTYQYAQVNVNNTGSYLAKSTLGPASNPVTLDGVSALVTFQDPTAVDSQVNEVWIYRRGGNLGQWYRTIVIKAPFTPNPVYDPFGDQDALDLNIKIDVNLVSIADIPDKIYDIVGPIQGRWYYFSTNFMYPSDINDPDLVNASLAVRTCGSTSELFMWARPVSASVVLIGTSIDCYLLTGTFSTFPDGTIDIYYQSLGVKFPPVTYDATPFGGSIYYLASDGWRFVMPTSFGTNYSNQNNQSVVSPNTDRLYRGEVCHGYGPPSMPLSPGAVRFPVVVAKNKLWCFVYGTGRGEVYDFVRQYWRPFIWNLGDASACTVTQDNRVLAFYPDLKVREVDYSGTKLIDESIQQTSNMLFTYKDNGKPRNRKDTYTFKSRCFTGFGNSGPLAITIYNESNNPVTPPPLPRSNIAVTEVYVDLSQSFGINFPFAILPKSYQVFITGSLSDLVLEDFSIDFDSRPDPLTFLRIYPSNLGTATQKRVRTWPLVIDTLGQNVYFTPSVDGIDQAGTTFNSTYKKTVFHYFVTDVFGIDYGGTLYDPSGLMEVWDTGIGSSGGAGLIPDVVQNLPMSHKYDQVGPIEIFRWGKILRMALRTQSNGTPIPFKVYLGDDLFYSGQFNVDVGKEDEYVVDLPKGVSGSILRVELGPCPFTFSRYFMKFQVAISGAQKDTELQWVTVPGVTSTLAAGI